MRVKFLPTKVIPIMEYIIEEFVIVFTLSLKMTKVLTLRAMFLKGNHWLNHQPKLFSYLQF